MFSIYKKKEMIWSKWTQHVSFGQFFLLPKLLCLQWCHLPYMRIWWLPELFTLSLSKFFLSFVFKHKWSCYQHVFALLLVTACWQVVIVVSGLWTKCHRLLNSKDSLQVIATTCYQHVQKDGGSLIPNAFSEIGGRKNVMRLAIDEFFSTTENLQL